MTVSYTKKEILEQLNYCARDYSFPMLDNGYIYLGDTRLSAYRDGERWALVIEVLGYSVRTGWHYGLHNCLYCFGNCLNEAPGMAPEQLVMTTDSEDDPTFREECDWYVREEAKTVNLRGVDIPLKLSPEQLVEKGIELVEPPHITGAELMRSLLPEYREQLLATEEELRAQLPTDLPMILRLEDWPHPDLVNGELPSESETFQLLSEVLVTGDPALYVPSKEPNTHWKNWPDSGSL
jgi:hypothetical protein